MEGYLLGYAQEVLGRCSPAADRHERSGGSHLLEVVDAGGTHWYVKHVERLRPWRAEARAYRRWVPTLGDHAPSLRAADDERQIMVLSAVSGRRPAGDDAYAHRQAGAVLRRLHRARPSRPAPPDFAHAWSQRLENWLADADGAFSASERHFARVQTRRLRTMDSCDIVPCHGDYRPYNWLLDEDCVLRVIDFGDARVQVWAWDLVRLFLGPWWDHPHLADAFLDGYGVALTDEEELLVDLHSATQAAIQVAWGRKHGRDQVEDAGRERLRQLMAGRSVVAAAG